MGVGGCGIRTWRQTPRRGDLDGVDEVRHPAPDALQPPAASRRRQTCGVRVRRSGEVSAKALDEGLSLAIPRHAPRWPISGTSCRQPGHVDV